MPTFVLGEHNNFSLSLARSFLQNVILPFCAQKYPLRVGAVCPGWAIFESSWEQSSLQKYLTTILGYCEKWHFLYYTHVDSFWATFKENWATFYSNIWSHWVGEKMQRENRIERERERKDVYVLRYRETAVAQQLN